MVKKIAFATVKGGLDDVIADRFGRASTFTIVEVDEEKGEILNVKVVENPWLGMERGVGVRVVQMLVNEKVDVVVGPSPGPHAYQVLQQAGIEIVVAESGTPVRDILTRLLKK